MSDDLIKRSDAIKIMACEMYAEAQSQGYEVDSIEDFMPEAKTWMNDAPSVDRPQGEWIDRGMRVPCSWVKKCSLCGHETDTWRWCNFCPNCGARMFAKDINVPNKKGADDE